MGAQKGDILAQGQSGFGLVKALFVAAAAILVCAMTVLTAFGIAPGTAPSDAQAVLVRETIPLEEPAPATQPPPPYVTQERVLRGDTVAAIFDRLGISDPRALEWLKSDASGRLIFRQLVPGRMLQAETGPAHELLALRYFMGPSTLVEVQRIADTWTARKRGVADTPRIAYKTAVINSSLFAATDAAGIPDAIAMQVARVFGTDIDFHTDLRKGDRIAVAYEMIYESGELVAPGRIVAARLVNGGHTFDAVLFHDEDGVDSYYSLDGASRAKAFLRSPVEFSRVSSGFGSRFHPIFKNWRAHTGVDFAAPKGTRVLASADGTIISAGWHGGYGNAIEIRHGGGVTTLYGHLSGFASGIRAGARVHQGEPIGFVGATGWATGPHLHYEFRVAGIFQDPLRVALPKADPVPAALKPEFERVAQGAHATIDLVASSTPARFE